MRDIEPCRFDLSVKSKIESVNFNGDLQLSYHLTHHRVISKGTFGLEAMIQRVQKASKMLCYSNTINKGILKNSGREFFLCVPDDSKEF